MKINSLIGLVVFIFAIIIFISYGIQAMGSVDSTTDVINTTYSEQYNATSDVFQTTVSFAGYLPLIGAICVILVALIIVRKML